MNERGQILWVNNIIPERNVKKGNDVSSVKNKKNVV